MVRKAAVTRAYCYKAVTLLMAWAFIQGRRWWPCFCLHPLRLLLWGIRIHFLHCKGGGCDESRATPFCQSVLNVGGIFTEFSEVGIFCLLWWESHYPFLPIDSKRWWNFCWVFSGQHFLFTVGSFVCTYKLAQGMSVRCNPVKECHCPAHFVNTTHSRGSTFWETRERVHISLCHYCHCAGAALFIFLF